MLHAHKVFASQLQYGPRPVQFMASFLLQCLLCWSIALPWALDQTAIGIRENSLGQLASCECIGRLGDRCDSSASRVLRSYTPWLVSIYGENKDHESISGPSLSRPLCPELYPNRNSSGNQYPFTNPPFYVHISHGYDMDITKSGIIFLFQKRYIWIYLGYPRLKNCIWYIPGISFHVTCHTYPCPIHVISLSGCPVQANEIQPEIALLRV